MAASKKLLPVGFTPAHAWARLGDFMGMLPLITPSSKVLEHTQVLHSRAGHVPLGCDDHRLIH